MASIPEDVLDLYRRPPKPAKAAPLSHDEDLAVRTIIGEAKGEGERGWGAVAGVIRNRSKQSGKGFGDVVLAPNQFEPWGSRRKELESYDPNSSVYQNVARATLPILRGERDDPTGGATHFYSPGGQKQLGRSAPSWDNGKGIDIGNHRFFNLGYTGKGLHGTEPNSFKSIDDVIGAYGGYSASGEAPQAASAPKTLDDVLSLYQTPDNGDKKPAGSTSSPTFPNPQHTDLQQPFLTPQGGGEPSAVSGEQPVPPVPQPDILANLNAQKAKLTADLAATTNITKKKIIGENLQKLERSIADQTEKQKVVGGQQTAEPIDLKSEISNLKPAIANAVNTTASVQEQANALEQTIKGQGFAATADQEMQRANLKKAFNQGLAVTDGLRQAKQAVSSQQSAAGGDEIDMSALSNEPPQTQEEVDREFEAYIAKNNLPRNKASADAFNAELQKRFDAYNQAMQRLDQGVNDLEDISQAAKAGMRHSEYKQHQEGLRKEYEEGLADGKWKDPNGFNAELRRRAEADKAQREAEWEKALTPQQRQVRTEYKNWLAATGANDNELSQSEFQKFYNESHPTKQVRKKGGRVRNTIELVEDATPAPDVLTLPGEPGVRSPVTLKKDEDQNGLTPEEVRYVGPDGEKLMLNPTTRELSPEKDGGREIARFTLHLADPETMNRETAAYAQASELSPELANYLDLPEEDVREYFRLRGFTDFNTGKPLPSERLFKSSRFDPITGTATGENDTDNFILTDREEKRIREFAAIRKRDKEAYESAKKSYAENDDEYIASLKAARDVGWMSDEQVQKEITAVQAERDKVKDIFSKSWGGVEGVSKDTIERQQEQVLSNIRSRYGSVAAKNEAERQDAERLSKLSNSDVAWEAGRQVAKVVPDMLSAVLKTAGTAEAALRNLVTTSPGSNYGNLKTDETLSYALGDAYDWFSKTKIGSDPVAAKAWTPTIANGAAQAVVMAGLAWASGGAALPGTVGMSQGFAQQYDRGKDLGATELQRVELGVVGAMAAMPDILLMRGWFKHLKSGETIGLFEKMAETVWKPLAAKVGEREAANILTKGINAGLLKLSNLGIKTGELLAEGGHVKLTWPEAIKKIGQGSVFEPTQEVSENKINSLAEKWIAGSKITYDEIASWTPEDTMSAVGGLGGGLFGGAVEITTHPDFAKNYKDKRAANRAIDEAFDADNIIYKEGKGYFKIGDKQFEITPEIEVALSDYNSQRTLIQQKSKELVQLVADAKKAIGFTEKRSYVEQIREKRDELATLSTARIDAVSKVFQLAPKEASDAIVAQTKEISAEPDTPSKVDVEAIIERAKVNLGNDKFTLEPESKLEPPNVARATLPDASPEQSDLLGRIEKLYEQGHIDDAQVKELLDVMDSDPAAVAKQIDAVEKRFSAPVTGERSDLDSSLQTKTATTADEPTVQTNAAAPNLEPKRANRMVAEPFATSKAAQTETSATEAAHDAATSPKNDLTEPTQAQKEAGNSGSLKGVAKIDQPVRDRVLADAKLFGDGPDAQAAVAQGFESINREGQHVILAKVVRSLDDDKIFRAVVQTVPVDVMDLLIGRERAAKNLLHDKSVLTERLTVPRDVAIPKPVATFVNSLATAVERVSAETGTEKTGLSLSRGPVLGESHPAMETGKSASSSHVVLTGNRAEQTLSGGTASTPTKTNAASVTDVGIDDRHIQNDSSSDPQKQAGNYLDRATDKTSDTSSDKKAAKPVKTKVKRDILTEKKQDKTADKKPHEMSREEYDAAFPKEKDGQTVTASNGSTYELNEGVGGKWWAQDTQSGEVKTFASRADMRDFLYGHASHHKAVSKAVREGVEVAPEILSGYSQLERIANKKRADRIFKFQADEKASEILADIRKNGKAGITDLKSDISELKTIAQKHNVTPEEVDRLINTADTGYRRMQARDGSLPEEGSRPPKGKVLVGKDTLIRIPGEKTAYKARYVLRALSDVEASHNAFNFNPNPEYWFTNDRHYDKQKGYQASVIEDSQAANFQPEQVVNNAPTAEIGPPVIDADGNVRGGNSREQKIERIWASENPKAKNAYVAKIKEEAAAFGLNADDVSKYDEPFGLYRELTEKGTDAQRTITDLNKVSAKDLSQAEAAIAGGTNVSDEALNKIADAMDRTGSTATITEMLNAHGPDIVQTLIGDGVFNENQRNTLIQDGKITDTAKQRVRQMLLGHVFEDLEQLEYAPASVKNNIEKVIVPLIKTQREAAWDILPKVREAIDLLTEHSAKSGKESIDNFVKQESLVKPEGWSDEAIAIAKTLRSDYPVSPFKVYAGELRNAETGSMFGAMTPDEAFQEAFVTKSGAPVALRSKGTISGTDDEGVEIPLDSLYNSSGEIDHEHIQNAVDNIVSGIHRISRLAPEGERGRIQGARLCVGASLIVGGESRTATERDPRKRRNREEDLLEAYAKHQNAWIDDVDAFKQSLGVRLIGGMEADVYESSDGSDFVIKLAPIPYIIGADSSILRFFDDKIAIHNSLPHTTPYELIGFTRDLNTTRGSTFLAVLRQPYIKGKEIIAPDAAFVKQMQADGFVLDYTGSRFTGNGVEVLDITTHNVIKGEDGAYHIFDPMVSYGNDAKYEPLSIVQTKKSDDGTILRQKATAEAVNRLHNELPFAHLADVLDQATGGEFNEAGELHLTEADGDIVRRLRGSVASARAGETVKEPSFNGVVLDAGTLREMASHGRETAEELRMLYYPHASIEKLQKIAANLDELADRSRDFGITYVFDEALPEERFHQRDLRAGRTDVQAENEIADQSAIFQHPGDLFNQDYGSENRADKISEIIAKLATGQETRYGWDKLPNFEAERDKIRKLWADGVIRNNLDADGNLNVSLVEFEEVFRYAYYKGDRVGEAEVGDRQGGLSDDEGRARSGEEGEGQRGGGTAADGQQGPSSDQFDDSGAVRDEQSVPEGQEEPKLKTRKTVLSAEKYGVIDSGAITGTPRYYKVKSTDERTARAQSRIEIMGIENAVQDARQPITNLLYADEQVAFQWETVHLLNELAHKAEVDGSTALAAGYQSQKKEVLETLAMQGTPAGRMVQAYDNVRREDARTVTEYVERRRRQNGYDVELDTEQKTALKEQALALALEHEKVLSLQARIEELESKAQGVTKLNRGQKTLVKVLTDNAHAAMQRLKGAGAVMRSVGIDAILRSTDNVPAQSLEGQLLNDLSDVGAAILFNGFYDEDVITPTEFETEFNAQTGGIYATHWKTVHAHSMEKLAGLRAEMRRQNTIDRVKAANPDLVDEADIQAKIDEETSHEKARQAVRREHRKLANDVLKAEGSFTKRQQASLLKEYERGQEKEAEKKLLAKQKMHDFLDAATRIAPNVGEEVLTAAALIDTSPSMGTSEMSFRLRQMFPDLKTQENATDAQRSEKLQELSGILGQAKKLHERVKHQQHAERDAARGQTQEAKDLLAAVKRAKSEAQHSFDSLTASLEKPPLTVAKKVSLLQRQMMVSAINTAANNLWSGLVTRGSFRVVDAIDLGIQKTGRLFGKELKGENITADTRWADVLGFPQGDEAGFKTYLRQVTSAHSTILKALDEHPDLYNQLYGDYSSDIQDIDAIRKEKGGMIHKALDAGLYVYDKASFANRWQEYFVRDLEALYALQVRLGQRGLDLATLEKNGELNKITADDWQHAIHRARQVTYALKPERGTTADKVLGFLNDHPVPSVIVAPFAKFSWNVWNMTRDWLPGIAQIRAGRRVMSEEDGRLRDLFNPTKYTSRETANSLAGFIFTMAALGLVRAFGDRDDWYYLRVPFTEGMGRNGSSLYVDMRQHPEFSPFLYMASKLNRLIEGRDMFNYDDPKAIIGELGEVFLSLSYRQAVDQNSLLQSGLYGMQSPLQTLSEGLYRTGLRSEGSSDDKAQKSWYLLSKFAGERLGMAFSPLRPLKNVADSIIKGGDLDLDNYPFTQGLERQIPRAILQKVGGFDSKKNAVTGETKNFNPYGWLKPIGLNVVDDQIAEKQMSETLRTAKKLAFDDPYTPPVTAAEKKLRDTKRDIYREMEKLRQQETPEMTQKEKTELYKPVMDAVKKATDDGVLTDGQADRIKDAVGKSELAGMLEHENQNANLLKIYKTSLTDTALAERDHAELKKTVEGKLSRSKTLTADQNAEAVRMGLSFVPKVAPKGSLTQDTKGKPEGSEFKDDKSFIGRISTYAKAIGSDPVDAFNKWYAGETIRRTDNGTIIVERMTLADSQRVKHERGAGKDMMLDHTVPLQLGGMNDEDHLKLVPREEWARYTPVENALGRALRSGKIDGEKARALMNAFKQHEIDEAEINQEIGSKLPVKEKSMQVAK